MIVHEESLNKDFKKFEPCNECIGKAFQMDDYGNFRIVVHGFASKWVSYNSIASLEYDGVKYIGVSAYYEGTIPHECIVEIKKTDIIDSEEHSST